MLLSGVQIEYNFPDRKIRIFSNLCTNAGPSYKNGVKAALNRIHKLNPLGASMGELMQTSDVTGVVSFLAGPDSKFITGQTIEAVF